MIKLLFVVSTLQRSGPVFVIYNIIKYLDRVNYKITILTLSPEKQDSLKNIFEMLGIKVISLNISRPTFFLKAKKLLLDICNDINPDVIHSHCLRADYAVFSLNLKNVVTTVHGELIKDYTYQYGHLAGKFVTSMHLSLLNKFGSVISCSRSVEKYLQINGIYSDSIPNGVDTDIFNPVDPVTKSNMRTKLGLPPGKKIIVSIGSLIHRKNPLMVIEGFKKLNEDCLLVILGSGYGKSSLENECKALAADDQRILFKGRVYNVDEYLRCSDYFISASYSEGLPNSVIESLGCGIPVILSNIPSHSEVLELNTAAGVLFEQDNIDSLLSNASELFSKSYSDSSAAACDIISSHLSAEIMSSRYSEIYQRYIS